MCLQVQHKVSLCNQQQLKSAVCVASCLLVKAEVQDLVHLKATPCVHSWHAPGDLPAAVPGLLLLLMFRLRHELLVPCDT